MPTETQIPPTHQRVTRTPQTPAPLDAATAASQRPGKTSPSDPLQGTVLRYEDPFEPVAEDEWEALG